MCAAFTFKFLNFFQFRERGERRRRDRRRGEGERVIGKITDKEDRGDGGTGD